MNIYEILLIENDIYYIHYYKSELERSPIFLKLDKDSYSKWKLDKIER